MNRVLSVARIQVMWQALLWPVAIMFTSFAINVALFGSIGDKIPSPHITGGLASIYVVQFIVCAQAMTQTFSFAVGLNATRRAFYLGTALVMAGQSLAYGVMLYGLKLIEHATNGWGVDLGFFDVGSFTRSENPVQILVYGVPMILCSVAGLFSGIVAKRWGGNGVLAMFLIVGIVLGGLAVLVTWTQSWTAVWHWLIAQSGLGLTLGWTLLPLTLLGFGSYGLLRRAVP